MLNAPILSAAVPEAAGLSSTIVVLEACRLHGFKEGHYESAHSPTSSKKYNATHWGNIEMILRLFWDSAKQNGNFPQEHEVKLETRFNFLLAFCGFVCVFCSFFWIFCGFGFVFLSVLV